MAGMAEARTSAFFHVIHRTQAVARAYRAACTLNFFGFNADLALKYRGHINTMRNLQRAAKSRNNLFQAMLEIARTGRALPNSPQA